ncbi:uncharacterized protein LOC112550044 [Alligator sinensis]|uniref:Uncharacterized protein LOC112550044 n=1 Tax=Alligator sinensis TaxID=38654 RepID=A0A3Q0GF71_ALLSI|nr:uncharacterized protein LOC112550044 [Alligator sinensis]
MATRMGLGENSQMAMRRDTLELELVRNCPWRDNQRQVKSFEELEALIAYHQAGGTGERFVSGHLSLKGDEGVSEEGAPREREVYLLLFRPFDTVSLVGPSPADEADPTSTRVCALCLRYAREDKEPEPIAWFPPFMAARLRGRELPSELHETLEAEERAADERMALWYDKGGEDSVTFHTIMNLMHQNLSLKAQLQMAVRTVKEATEKKEPKMSVQDGAEQEGDRVEELEEKGGASEEPARVRSATPPIDTASLSATPPSDAAAS